MGNTGSSKADEQKQHRAIKNIVNCLHTHRQNVYSVAHSVETQHAHVQLLTKSIGDIVSETTDDNCDVSLDDDFTKDCSEVAASRICYHCTSEWQRNTRRLLGSIQTSLRCQSISLQSSFKKVNSSIHAILDNYRIEIGSSVDKETDFWIDYDESPQVDFEQKYRDLEKNSTTKVEKLQEKIKSLQANISKDKHEFEELTKHQNETLDETTVKLKQLEKDFETLRIERNMLEENKSESEKVLRSMGNHITSQNADKEALKLQLKALKSTLSIQLYFSAKGDTMLKLLDELKTMLINQMQVDRHELQFVICQNGKDVNPEIPLLVLCINASRLGAVASSALQNLNVSSNVSILIFHHKDKHALPNQTSDRVLTGPEFKALGGMFDIAFLAEKGIYPCDMNHAAAVGIEQFLRMQR